MAAVLLGVGAAEVHAAGTQYQWTGSAGTGDWSTAANWSQNPASLGAAFSPDFTGTNSLITTTTNSTFSALTRITFLAGAPSFTLNGVGTGSTVALSDRIDNLSTSLQTINFNLSLAAVERFDAVAGGTNRINGVISGAGGITINGAGAGTTILTGSNSYAALTTVTAGVLNIRNDSALGSTAAATTVASGAALELEGNITVSEALNTLIGTGISNGGALRNVSGTNTWGGLITFNNATRINADANSRLVLDVATGNAITASADALTFGGAGDIAVLDPISNQVTTVTKDGAGTLTLSAANAYTGATTISAGWLRATSNAGALGASTLSLGGGNLELAGDSGINFARNTTLTASGTIMSDRLTAGAGVTHTLGTLSIGAQTLTLVTDVATVTSGTSGLTFGAVTLSANNAAFVAEAGTLLSLGGFTGAGFGFSVGGAGDTAITGVIGTTTGTLAKAGSGRLTLSAANTYTGLTTLSGGTLAYGIANALSTGGVTISNGATLDLSTFSDSVGTVTLTSGNIVGSGTLTSTANFATTTGTISAPLGGAVGVAQAASGTTVLSGASTFSGASTIAAGGVLNIRNANALGTTAAGVTITSGGALELQGGIAVGAEPLTLAGGGISSGGALRNVSGTNSYGGGLVQTAATRINADADRLTLSGTIGGAFGLTFGGAGDTVVSGTIVTGAGGLTKDGAGGLTLSAANTYTGVTTISSGTLSASSIVVASGASNLGNATSAVVLGDATNRGTLSYTGNTASYTRGLTLGAGGGGLDVTTAGQTLTVGTGSVAGTGLFSVGGAGNVTMSSTISGVSGLTKAGSGTLTLSAANTFGGTTTVGAGVVSVASVAVGAVNQPLGTGNTLNLGVAGASSGRLLYAGATGTLSKNVNALGNGTDTIQNAGTGLLSLSGTLTKDGTILRLQGGDQGITVTGRITGTSPNSDLAVQNGLTTLSTTNDYVGPTFINSSGTLALGVSDAIPSNSAVTIGGTFAGGNGGVGVLSMGSFTNQIGSLAFSGSGGTVRMAPTSSSTSALVLSATGAVNLAGSSALDLSGMATGAGLYRLVGGSSLTGTFATVTGLATNYELRYGTVNANSVDAQRKADQNATFTLTTSNARALVNTSVALSGTITNSSPVDSTALSLGLGSTGQLTVSGFTTGSVAGGSSGVVSGTIASGTTVGSRTWTVLNTDSNAITTTSTATGVLQVVNQRTFTTSTSTLALGFVHQGGSIGTPTVTVTSTGLNAVTANATLGAFTGGPGGGFSLGLSTGTNVFSGTGATQAATYTLSGSTATPGAISGTFTSAVTGEFAGIPNVTVAVTGQVYSGQSTWATDGGGNWGTVASGFGVNWGSNQGSPGLDGSFTNTDTATFGSALTGGTAAILLNGAAPSLQGITFNSSGSYEIYPGSGGGPITLLNAGANPATVSSLAGSHAIHADITLGSSVVFDVAAGSTLSLHTAIDGAAGKTLTKSGSGTLNLLGNNTYLGNTLITEGLVSISSAGAFGSGTVMLSAGATLDLNGQAVTNTIDAGGGTVLNPASSFATFNVSGSTTFEVGPYSKGTYNISSGGLATFQNSPYQATVNVNNGGGAVFNAEVSGTATVNVNAGGRATVAAAAAGNFFVTGSATFASTLTGDLSVLGGGVVAFNGSNSPGSTFDVASGGLVNVGSAATIGGPLHVSGSAVIAGSVTSGADVIVQSGGNVKLTDSASFAQPSLTNNGSFVVDRTSNLTLATAISGSGGLQKLGSSILTLTGTSTASGLADVAAGKLVVNGGLGSGGVSVAAGASLAGSGAIGGAIGGGGLIEPGSSPGILTAASLDPSGGVDFAFEFTGTTAPVWSNASSSGNDLLRLTDATDPFAGSLGATNVVSVYFDVASIAGRAKFTGGFFTDLDANFLSSIQAASYMYYVKGDGSGTAAFYNGQGYYSLSAWAVDNIYDYRGVTRTTVQVASADFASGTVTDGWSTQFIVVPEPSTLLLGLIGGLFTCTVMCRRARHLRRFVHPSSPSLAPRS